MAQFNYTALKNGKKVTGSMEATGQDIVMDNLRKQGLHPLVVKVEGGFSPLSRLHRTKKVKLKDLAVFTRQFSTMVAAGVPLNRSLATLQAQTNNKYFQKVILNIGKDVESGKSLAESFAKYPNIFSDVYVSMVAAGEAGGILDKILKRIASQVEQDASMRKKIKSAMTYPMVIFSITILAFFGIMIFIIPKLGKIIQELGGPDAQLPIYTQIMLDTSNFMQQNFILILVALFIGSFFLRRYIRTPKGKHKFHYILLKIPVLKTVIVKIAIARFARTFASLMSAGVGVLDALQVTGGAIGNKVIEKELKEAAINVKNGKQLSVPLSQSKYFPPMVAQMLAIGEETGQIDTILVKVADFYEEEVEATIDGLSSIIEPLMIVVLGSMVGLIAASVMGPITSLSKNIGN
jgi:type IV pilus assembly protein PilC